MKLLKLFKYLITTLIAIVFIIALTLFVITYFYGDKIKKIAIEELNNQIATKINVEEINFSLFRKFPNASLELKNIVAFSSDKLDKSMLHSISTDTLFAAKSLILQFNLIDIYHKKFILKKINLENGKLLIFEDRSGNVNYDIFKKNKADSTNSNLSLHLKNVRLTNIKLQYYSTIQNIELHSLIVSMSLKGDFEHNNILFFLETHSTLNSLIYKNESLVNEISFSASSKITTNKNSLKISNGKLRCDDNTFYFDIADFLHNTQNNIIHISSSDADIPSLLKLLPYKYLNSFQGMKTDGKIKFDLSFSGTDFQIIKANFSVKNGNFTYDKFPFELEDFKCEGVYQYSETEKLDLKNLHFTFNNENELSADCSFEGLDSSKFTMNVNSTVNLNDLQKIFKTNEISSITGKSKIKFNCIGKTETLKNISLQTIINPIFNGKIEIENADCQLKDSNFKIENANASFTFDNELLTIDRLNSVISGNEISLNGKVFNFKELIFNEENRISMQLNVLSDHFDYNKFSIYSKSTDNEIVRIPEKLSADITIYFKKFIYNKFNASNVRIHSKINNNLLEIKTLSLESMKGNLNVSGTVDYSDKNIEIKTKQQLRNIDITELFYTFDNFGQNYICDKHLKGKISGETDLQMSMNEKLEIDENSMKVNAKVEISNGELVDFEPMTNLSKFIEVSELKHIRFSKLNNTISIDNRVITIPKFEIKSSAFNLSLSGQHDFDNNISYRIKVLMSEVLAKKTMKSKKENEEFGVEEDDGLGKNSLYLLVKGTVENYKIVYDTKAASESLKNDLHKEKNELKTIMKDEFGWFKNDTSTSNSKTKKQKTNKVRIKWDDQKEEPIPEEK